MPEIFIFIKGSFADVLMYMAGEKLTYMQATMRL